jgi:hypothetical protein
MSNGAAPGSPFAVEAPAVAGADPFTLTGGEVDDAERISAGAELASAALTELSRLSASSYTPAVTPAPRSSGTSLTRRAPREAPQETEEPVASPSRQRTAEEVRGMLSGFRTGVERGRTSSDPSEHDPVPAPPHARS